MPYMQDPDNATPADQVRLLLNDVDPTDQVFTDQEIKVFLELEGWAVKLAAAQAIDTNASNEVLASKVLRTQDLSTDGAKVAQALREHADRLRAQHEAALDSDGFFEVVEAGPSGRPELTDLPYGY